MTVAEVVIAVLLPPGVGWVLHIATVYTPGFVVPFLAAWALEAAGEVVASVLPTPVYPMTAGGVLSGALAWGLWWWRRRRRRAPRAYGAKSRALIAALAARLRDTPRSRPALRPAPGGAQ